MGAESVQKIDPEEHKLRRELDKERRGLWEKIVLIDSGILGIVLPFIISSGSGSLAYPKLTYSLFLLTLLVGIFLMWLDNKRRLFVLDFAEIIQKQFDSILNSVSDDKPRDIFELFRIEKRFGFSRYIDGFDIVKNYLEREQRGVVKVNRLLDRHWSKHGLHEKTLMRSLYLIEPQIVFIFYLSFIAGVFLLSLRVFLG